MVVDSLASKKVEYEAVDGAQLLVETLKAVGVKYVFANTGTDYPAILEAFAKLRAQGNEFPKVITVPHEMAAVSMAHGYAMVSGEPQAVMVHTLPGTANAVCGVINASRNMIPLILIAGRTPITEKILPGSRDLYIHWAQESRDQAALLREFAKWDYEIRFPEQVPEVVLRAWKISLTEPKGPVYISLPREWSIQKSKDWVIPPVEDYSPPTPPQADAEALDKIADLLLKAEKPVIATRWLGKNPEAVKELVKLAELLSIPVNGAVGMYMNFPTNNPLSYPYPINEADLIFVINSDLPWIPNQVQPRPDAKVIHLDINPSYPEYPMWSFPAHLAVSGDSASSLRLLTNIVARKMRREFEERARERYAEIESLYSGWRRELFEKAVKQSSIRPISPAWLSHCIGKVKHEEDIVVNEYDFNPDYAEFTKPGTYFLESDASCLGWSLGAALGAKLAFPKRTVIAAVGDGAYIFCNPVACHFVSASSKLPILVVVYNNGVWDAVRRTVAKYYPDGWVMKTRESAGIELKPSPRYDKIAEAHGAYAEIVEDPDKVESSLRRALDVVEKEGRQALLNVVCG
ncbi:MAG: thiamine pyrophosphate-requiring protein [Candidatus Caldarchaeum sp.]|nr:thiamine pyrophosphate-requiring protein [Candidatus Caldarchaeum sp.]